MDTQMLYEFIVLSKTLNFSKAAKILYISQPVLSRHVKELEQEFGVPLLTRSTHHVTLTEAGRVLSQKAPELIDQCDRAIVNSRFWHNVTEATIRIACVVELSYAQRLIDFIQQFRLQHPNIRTDIQVLTNGTPEAVLQDPAYDIILTPCRFVTTPPHIQKRFIDSQAVAVALHPKHPLRTKNLILMNDLIGENLLVPFANELFGPYAKIWKIAENYTENKLTYLKMPNLATALFEASTGSGIVIVPEFAQRIAPDNLHFIPLANRHCRYDEYIYYRETDHNPGARVFYQEFCQAFQIENMALF